MNGAEDKPATTCTRCEAFCWDHLPRDGAGTRVCVACVVREADSAAGRRGVAAIAAELQMREHKPDMFSWNSQHEGTHALMKVKVARDILRSDDDRCGGCSRRSRVLVELRALLDPPEGDKS